MNRLVAATALAAVALFMLSGFFASDASPADPATLVALALGVGLPAAWAGILVRAHHRERTRGEARRDALREQTLDLDLLRLARDHAGRITAVEAAMELSVPPEHAQAALDRLVLRRVAEVEVTDAGVLVYAFHDLRHLQEKHTARGVLDA